MEIEDQSITFSIEIFIQTQFEFVKISFPSYAFYEGSSEDYKGPHQLLALKCI
jgi:hypothetical protein